MSAEEVQVTIRDGPRVQGVDLLAPGGAVLRLGMALASGQWVVLDIQHPSFPAPLVAPARLVWSRTGPDGVVVAGFELHGTWERLATVRRSLLGILGSRALVDGRLVGWVLRDPADGTWACHSVHTVKIAVVSDEEGQLVVRSRDDGSVTPASSLGDGVAQALGLEGPPLFDPPLPEDEQAILAARTVVMSPGRALVPSLSPPPREGEDLPAAGEKERGPTGRLLEPRGRANEVRPPEPKPASPAGKAPPSGRPSETGPARAPEARPRAPEPRPILPSPAQPAPQKPAAKGASSVMRDPHASSGLRRPQHPFANKQKQYSQILAGEDTVGWITSTGQDSWTAYDLDGRHVAVIAAQGADGFRLCWFGDKATESLEFLDAPTCLEALAAAFELDRLPRVEPALPGIS